MTQVALEGVALRYGEIEVLRSVNAVVPAGRTVAVYGRSGSGKTTLLNLIAGLDHPTRGRIRVVDTEVSALSDNEATPYRRRTVGIIFPAYDLLRHLTAWENVVFGMRLRGLDRTLWRERCEWALDAVGLTKRSRHRPAELSGGERQRVAIARVLAISPPLILADEPTGALGHATGLRMVDLLAHHVREAGASLWIATGVEPPAGRLSLGQFMRIEVVTDVRENVLFLPLSAIREFRGRSFITVVEGESRREVSVETGLANDRWVEIVSGLREGDRVIGR